MVVGRGIQTQWDNILILKLVGRYIVRHGITSIFVFHDQTNKIQLNDLLKNLNTSDNIQFQKKNNFHSHTKSFRNVFKFS